MRASNVIGILSENGLHHGSNALSSLEMLYSNCCIILAELSIAHISHFRLLRRCIHFRGLNAIWSCMSTNVFGAVHSIWYVPLPGLPDFKADEFVQHFRARAHNAIECPSSATCDCG